MKSEYLWTLDFAGAVHHWVTGACLTAADSRACAVARRATTASQRVTLHALPDGESLLLCSGGDAALQNHHDDVGAVRAASPGPQSRYRAVDPRHFFGCVHWSGLYCTLGGVNFVEDGIGRIADLGFGVVKIKLDRPSRKYSSSQDQVPLPPHDDASLEDVFDRVFYPHLAAFHTVVMSTRNPLEKDASYFLRVDGELEREEEVFARFTRHLVGKADGKCFILQNCLARATGSSSGRSAKQMRQPSTEFVIGYALVKGACTPAGAALLGRRSSSTRWKSTRSGTASRAAPPPRPP